MLFCLGKGMTLDAECRQNVGLSPICPFCHKTVEQLIEDQLATGPKSAADITKWLRDTGHMPAMWTVIDVADFLREWYSGGA